MVDVCIFIKSIAKVLLTFILSPFVLFVLGQNKLSGVYQTNFATYGMFGRTLTLNCDSSAVINFRGDLLNDNSFGNWTTDRKILTLTFDSTLHPQQRYKGQFNYKIKRNRLYLVNFTRNQYQELKEKIEEHSKENATDLKLPSYRNFKKKFGRTMKNHSGKTGTQYLKKIKSTDCERKNIPNDN